MENLTPDQCPKFRHCNAPICPLDSGWQKRKHFNGDRVCFYLLEAQKYNAKAIFATYGKSHLYEPIERLTYEIANAYSPIKYALARAKLTSSRMLRKLGDTNAE